MEKGLRTLRRGGDKSSEMFVGTLLQNACNNLTFAIGSEDVCVLPDQDISFAAEMEVGSLYLLEFNVGGTRILKISTATGTKIWTA